MAKDHPPICQVCYQPMKLVRTIPSLGPAWPALLAYYCAPCREAETKEQVRAA